MKTILYVLSVILINSVTAAHKFYTDTQTNAFGDFSLGAGYDINRFEPKANHVFRESQEDLLYDIMPLTSTQTRCSLVANQKDITEKLFVHGSVSIKYKMITGSGSITYDSRKESMNKVAYYRCTVDRTLYTISVNVPEITEDWHPQDYISSDLLALDSEEAIIEEIGDYHIRSITYGRRYNTEIRIEYTSEDVFEQLNAQLKAEIGVGFLKVSAEVQLNLETDSFEEDLTMAVGSEALGFIEAEPLYLPSQTLSRKDGDKWESVSIDQQVDEMIQKNLEAFNNLDTQGEIVPKTGLSKAELFAEIGSAYPLWYSVDKNQRYFRDVLTPLSAFQEEQMLENLDQAYDIMRELKDMTDNIETRAEQLFNTYHLLSGATDLSMEFLNYRQELMKEILEYRKEVIDYIQQPAIHLAAKDIFFWALETGRDLEHISMDVLATKIWDLLGMEDVRMTDPDAGEFGAACLFNGIQATLIVDGRPTRRKFAGRVIFGDTTVRHVLFDVNGKVVSLGYIDHEYANRNNPLWEGIAHELVFVGEDCTLLRTGSNVWYKESRYKVSAIGSDEHLTSRGYVNKDKLTNIRMHLEPQDNTRELDVVITENEVMGIKLRGTETSTGFTVDASDRLMYRNGYVCDKGFQKFEANMICTHLGYADVGSYQTAFQIPASNAWGRPRITMVDLNCEQWASGLNDCTYTEIMNNDLWGACGTQNGVQLKCINKYNPSEESANMEVISQTVSCVQDEESMNERIDTAESCSGGAGDDAADFGYVQSVVVRGDICVKLYRDEMLECVISEKSGDWDFSLPDTLGRFCYGTYGPSAVGFPFPDQIEMMPTHRHEPCRDQEDLLNDMGLTFEKNGTDVPIIGCKLAKDRDLCDNTHPNNKLDLEQQLTVNEACFKTCTMCSANTRKHYQIKVVPMTDSFALNSEENIIPVEVTLNGAEGISETFNDMAEKVLSGDYECGSRIQLIATVGYENVECSMIMISNDGRIDTDGNVMVSGDIEVTFRCVANGAPVDLEATMGPTAEPTAQPTAEPTAEPTQMFEFAHCMVDTAGFDLPIKIGYDQTIESCSNVCRGSHYFALQHGDHCSCARHFGDMFIDYNDYEMAPDSECGSGTGGPNRMALYMQIPKGCVEGVIYHEQFCAKSSEQNCDGSTCTELGRQFGVNSLEKCLSLCNDQAMCEFASYTESNGDCLMYDQCPSARYYGNGNEGTVTHRICRSGSVLPQEIASKKKCGSDPIEWHQPEPRYIDTYMIDSYIELTTCANFILTMPESTCSHEFFHFNFGNFMCGCVSPGLNCENSEQQQDNHVVTSIFKIAAVP